MRWANAAPRKASPPSASAAAWASPCAWSGSLRFHRDAKTFTAGKAWGARDIAEIEGASVKLHWANQPYVWHVNDGKEVFVVLDGAVDMHYRSNDTEMVQRLEVGDIMAAEAGDEHVAHPVGEARILVVEKKGSA